MCVYIYISIYGGGQNAKIALQLTPEKPFRKIRERARDLHLEQIGRLIYVCVEHMCERRKRGDKYAHYSYVIFKSQKSIFSNKLMMKRNDSNMKFFLIEQLSYFSDHIIYQFLSNKSFFTKRY